MLQNFSNFTSASLVPHTGSSIWVSRERCYRLGNSSLRLGSIFVVAFLSSCFGPVFVLSNRYWLSFCKTVTVCKAVTNCLSVRLTNWLFVWCFWAGDWTFDVLRADHAQLGLVSRIRPQNADRWVDVMRSSSSRRHERVKNLGVCRTDQTKDCCAVSLQNGARKLFKNRDCSRHMLSWLSVFCLFVQSVNYLLKGIFSSVQSWWHPSWNTRPSSRRWKADLWVLCWTATCHSEGTLLCIDTRVLFASSWLCGVSRQWVSRAVRSWCGNSN